MTTHPQVISYLLSEERISNISPLERCGPGEYFALFFIVTLNLPKSPWIKIITHLHVRSNLLVKLELPIFLQKKDVDRTRIFHFFSSDLEIAQMTGQNHDTLSGHKQSFNEVRTYIILT